MDVGVMFGRLLDTSYTGTSGTSFVVPSDRFALVEISVSLPSGFGVIQIGTQKFTTDTQKYSVLAFARAGETITISFPGPSGANYRILVLHATLLT